MKRGSKGTREEPRRKRAFGRESGKQVDQELKKKQVPGEESFGGKRKRSTVMEAKEFLSEKPGMPGIKMVVK